MARLIASGSAITLGKSAASSRPHANAIQPPIEHGERALHQTVQAGRLGMGSREARQHRKFIHQRAHGFDRVPDGFRAGSDDFCEASSGGVPRDQVALNAFRRKCDRRQRILDLMRDPACDFAPCRLFLRPQ